MNGRLKHRSAWMVASGLVIALLVLGGAALAQSMFPDVEADNPHASAIGWAAEAGIIEGYENGNFGPWDEILRGQAASMFQRYHEYQMGTVTLEVTLENLTDGQPLSPPIFVTSDGGYKLFDVGGFADDDFVAIAEMGDNSAAAATAAMAAGVTDVEALDAPVGPGEMVTVTIEAQKTDVLSVATMLVRTNDGVTGVDRVMFPRRDGVLTLDLPTYDAGSEENNELDTHVPGPPFGGMMRAPTTEPIMLHPGLTGSGDVSVEMYGWTDPSARLTVEVVQ